MKKDKEGYCWTTCIVCGREYGTHPLTYRAKVDKNVCLDCFIFRKEEYMEIKKGKSEL